MRTDALSVLKDYQPGLADHDHPANRRFMVEVFAWMSAGLALTGAVAAYVGADPQLAKAFVQNHFLFYGALACQLMLVFVLTGWVEGMDFASAIAAFLLFAALNGATMSVIFLVYTAGSIAGAFFITAGAFAAMSAYGYATGSDLTSLGSLSFMGLVGIILAWLVNLYLKSPIFDLITAFVGVLVFVGLTAYDTQKIKQMDLLVTPGSEEEETEAVVGALTLYLDFINLFLDILRIMGKKKD